MIRLSVPGTLVYRDVAVRVVGSAARILRCDAPQQGSDLADEFASQIVSAFGEAFNNLVIHGYRGMTPGRVDIEARNVNGVFELELRDHGRAFDPSSHREMPDELPEGGMGLFIMRSFVDELRYCEGPPNVLTMVKRIPSELVGSSPS